MRDGEGSTGPRGLKDSGGERPAGSETQPVSQVGGTSSLGQQEALPGLPRAGRNRHLYGLATKEAKASKESE